MTTNERLQAVARALGMTPTDRLQLVKGGQRWRVWWLIGCVEGDAPMPHTEWCKTCGEALDAIERWIRS